jgi:hypothetical protein
VAGVRLAAAACILFTLAGCGSSGAGALGRGDLRWVRAPLVYQPPRLPHDRVVVGRVRNASRRPLRIDARRLVLRDAAGHPLVSSARFTAGFSHPLYGAFQQPSFHEPAELVRLGTIIDMPPGDTAPLFVAYRMLPSSRAPLSASFGDPQPLPLPVR